VSDRFPRCATCGRLVVRTHDGTCSPRCAELAARGYAARPQPAAALRPPAHAYDARLAVDGWPRALPAGVDDLGEIGPAGGGRRLLRVEADDARDIAAALDALGDAELLTLQRLVPGGLAGRGGEEARSSVER
jgi:hypothetical protein